MNFNITNRSGLVALGRLSLQGCRFSRKYVCAASYRKFNSTRNDLSKPLSMLLWWVSPRSMVAQGYRMGNKQPQRMRRWWVPNCIYIWKHCWHHAVHIRMWRNGNLTQFNSTLTLSFDLTSNSACFRLCCSCSNSRFCCSNSSFCLWSCSRRVRWLSCSW